MNRFAFSVIWEITQAGEILDVNFCKSIIHSVAGLTYNEAQLMLDDPNIHDVKAEGVRRLNSLAKIFRKRRMDAGALTLASPEARYVHHAFGFACLYETLVQARKWIQEMHLATLMLCYDTPSRTIVTGAFCARQ